MSYIIDKIDAHGLQNPDALAISSQHGVLSYAELASRVDELSGVLLAEGYQCLGLLADNSIEWAVVDLACLKAGICCVPVPGFFTPEQVERLCESAEVQALIGDKQSVSACMLDKRPNSYHGKLGIVVHALGTAVSPGAHSLRGISKVTFTSGSTGTPRGVRLDHDLIENTVRALDQAVPAGTSKRHLSVLPLVTLLENIAGLYLSLVQGAHIMLYSMSRIGFSGLANLDHGSFFRALADSRPESLILVPELLRLLVSGVDSGLVDPRHFRFLAVGGGVVSESILQQAAACGLPVFQGYGLSECASVVSLNHPGENRTGSVGKPLHHVGVRIADDGEILISGNIMAGYLGEPAVSEQWLATGDMGRLDEQGFLYVTGRKKNVLVTAYGKNISPEWVESVFQQSALIRNIVVTGEASTHLKAVIVPASMEHVDSLDRIVAEINRQLPEYARVRNYSMTSEVFLHENELLTPNGRWKRDAIAAHFA